MKPLLFILFLLPASVSAQLEMAPLNDMETDTMRGVALVVMEGVRMTFSDTLAQQDYLVIVLVRAIRARQVADVKMEGNIKAYHSYYFYPDGRAIPNEDVLLFKKRVWK